MYDLLKTELPKTSLPLPEDITALYGSLRDRGCTRVLHISISAGLSGTYNMCRMLAEEAEGIRVDVVDSRTLSCGLGLLVLTAAEMLEAGHPVEEVIAALEEKRKTQLGCFVIRTPGISAQGWTHWPGGGRGWLHFADQACDLRQPRWRVSNPE